MPSAEDFEQVRKATEDLIQVNVREIFQVQYGEETLIDGDLTVTLETAYDDAGLYEVYVVQAVDNDGVDIKEAISITKGTGSFVVASSCAGTLRWTSCLKMPYFNFWS